MGRAIVRMSPELILQALGFPKGTEILDIKQDNWSGPSVILALVSHADLKENEEGSEYPTIEPVFHTKTVALPPEMTAWDWRDEE